MYLHACTFLWQAIQIKTVSLCSKTLLLHHSTVKQSYTIQGQEAIGRPIPLKLGEARLTSRESLPIAHLPNQIWIQVEPYLWTPIKVVQWSTHMIYKNTWNVGRPENRFFPEKHWKPKRRASKFRFVWRAGQLPIFLFFTPFVTNT